MRAASCRPSTYLISFSTAKASISGSSVVPGLPNTISTPSCLSRSRKARFPDMTGKADSKGLGIGTGEVAPNGSYILHQASRRPRPHEARLMGALVFVAIYNEKIQHCV